jgi:glutamyl-tRNA reductase
MSGTLRLLGLSHHVAPVELRERVALDLEDAGALAHRLAAPGGEAVCLSTCNRTELYLVGVEEEAALDALGADSELADVLYRLGDEGAALHLFRVAAGLDSMVPGEGEILGQVRAAHDAGAPGPVLDRVFRQAVHVGKKARSETAIAESPSSVSSAAAALAQQVFGNLAGRKVLVIGAGKAAELAARSLAARGAAIATVASRNLSSAEALAGRFDAGAAGLDAVPAAVADVDIVVSSTRASGFVLERGHVADRRGRPLFLIDIAVPRDLDPSINELDGCYLYDIDDLEAVVEESLAGRRREAARAETLASEEADRFQAWLLSRDVVPAIASLRAHAERIRTGELERAESRLGRLSEHERRAVESITAQIVNKLLHLPTVRMKEAAATADGAMYASALEHLFGLEDDRR